MKPMAVAAIVGVLLGAGARLVDLAAPRWVGNVGAVWFLSAFLMGRAASRWKQSTLLGGALLGIACVAYYTIRVAVDGTISTGYLRTVGVAWLLVSLLVGAVAGLVGRASRRSSTAWGIVIGVFLGEALAVALLAQRWEQVSAEVVIALGLVAWSQRKASELLVPAAASTLLVALLAGLYRLVLR